MRMRIATVAMTVGTIAASSASANAGTITVPGDFASIQAAINAAGNTDEIVVGPGTYRERINTLGKSIFVNSSAGALLTIIDGNFGGPVVTCNSGEDNPTQIAGFTFINGVSDEGGGARLIGTSPMIVDCIFRDNLGATGGGGGAYVIDGAPYFIRCLFEENHAQSGGAIAAWGASGATIQQSVFRRNRADVSAGAVQSHFNDHITIQGCTFIDNEADHGGALVVVGGRAFVYDSDFVGNSCTQSPGGAISTTYGDHRMELCTFADNASPIAAVAVIVPEGDMDIVNCAFASNHLGDGGAALRVFLDEDVDVRVRDTLFCSNSPTDIMGEWADFGGNEFSDECDGPGDALLLDVQAPVGAITGGGLHTLPRSDDIRLAARSGFGATFVDLHHLDVRVAARTFVDHPSNLALTVETRINQSAGGMQLRLKNHNAGTFASVGQFTIGVAEQTHTAGSIPAANYVDDDGAIELSIKQIVFAPIFAFRFDSVFDHVGIEVN